MKVLIISNNDGIIYWFRRELLSAIAKRHDIVIASPSGKYQLYFERQGYKYIDTPIDRRGMNPLKDFALYNSYKKIIRAEAPDIVITYTIKCNIYGGYASRRFKIPYAANITGLGTAFKKGGMLTKFIEKMYRIALKNAKAVFVQNTSNKKLVIDKKIVTADRCVLLNGSGVNLEHFRYQEYVVSDVTRFLFVGRLMREKGLDELLEVAKRCHIEKLPCSFDFIGSMEEKYEDIFDKLQRKGILKYHGLQADTRQFVKNCDCVILPSYHEGMSNALLEGAAMGRALLASDIPGCRETMVDGVTGYLFKARQIDDLYDKVKRFVELPIQKKIEMGKKGREYVADNFDRNRVVQDVVNALEL